MGDTTRLSRSGRTPDGGTLTRRIDVPVSEELESEVIALATINGISKAEWVRNLLERVVHGELFMLRRLSRSGRTGQSDESGSNSR